MHFPKVHWQVGPRRGPAANRNLGASAGRSEWLIFASEKPRGASACESLQKFQELLLPT